MRWGKRSICDFPGAFYFSLNFRWAYTLLNWAFRLLFTEYAQKESELGI